MRAERASLDNFRIFTFYMGGGEERTRKATIFSAYKS